MAVKEVQSSLCENCPPWIAIAYPGPDTPTQQAVGVAIAVLVEDTDNQKERGNARNKSTLCFTRYTEAKYDEFRCQSPV